MFSADGIGGDDAYAVPFSVSRRQWGGAAILYGRFRWAVRKFFLSLRAKSVRIMDLKYVRSELQKLSEIIDSWNTRQETAALERDLVLEKLRKLYDAVRFGADADFAAVREDAAEEAAAEPAPTEIPVSIDLGEILPLDPFAVEAQAEPASAFEPDAAAKRDAVGEAGADFESESFAEVGTAFESESVAEAGAVSESESVSEPEPETVPESKPEFGSEQTVEPGVNFARHSEPAEEPVGEPEVVADSAEAFVAQSDSDGGTNPILEPEISAAEPVTESGPVASEPESEFSIEETTPSEAVAGNAAEPAAEQSVPLAETVREPEEASEKPEFIAEPVVESATESFAESLSESVAESVSESAAESVVGAHSESVAEPAAASAAAPAPSIDAEQTPAQETPAKAEAHSAPGTQPIAPTLFELEEETVRHRHKQRVIMSLYNTEPAAPAPKPASVPTPEPTAKPVAGGKPAAEASFAQPAVAGSASSGSAASDSVSAGTAAAGVSVSDATAGSALSAIPFTAPVTEPAASATTPVGSATTSLGSATTSAPVPDAFASRTPVAAPQPKTAETTAPDNAGDDEPDFEEITLEAKNTSGAVLGEVINHNVQTLADTIAPPRDVASELRRSEHVTDLRRAIGINDKFLMIRDLFGGDAAAYEAAIGTLNGFDDFDECMIYIAENYAWNANSDGAKFLMELLERKFA